MKRKKVKFLFIVSLPFNGSTILNMTLGSKDNVLLLGEAGKVFDTNGVPEICTCGERSDACDVWGGVIKDEMIYN